MAGPNEPSIIEVRPIMLAELKARANQLAAILDIPDDSYDGHEAEAYQVMGNLAAMPVIADHDRRRQYGIEILGNAGKTFSPWSPDGARFHAGVQKQVITIQEFPQYYAALTEDNGKLVEDYVTTTMILDAMKWGGFTGFAGASGKVFGGARVGAINAARGGTAAAVATNAARGAVIGGVGAAGKLMTGGLVGRASVFVWVIGEVAYADLLQQQIKMKLEITRRFQEGRLSSAEWQRAMGKEVSPPAQYLFPLK